MVPLLFDVVGAVFPDDVRKRHRRRALDGRDRIQGALNVVEHPPAMRRRLAGWRRNRSVERVREPERVLPLLSASRGSRHDAS
jgi:hypothetical protein